MFPLLQPPTHGGVAIAYLGAASPDFFRANKVGYHNISVSRWFGKGKGDVFFLSMIVLTDP